ncbi:response regulator transcription factor [Methylobacterium sp. CM6257]
MTLTDGRRPAMQFKTPIRVRRVRQDATNRPVDAPTARERELITHIASGLPNKLIAYEMSISPNTVRAHISNVMRKYKLQNRTQIATMLMPMLRSRLDLAARTSR